MASTSSSRPRVLMAVHSAKPAGAQLVALGQARTLAQRYDVVTAVGAGPLRAPFAELGPVVRGPTRLPIWGEPPAVWALELARTLPDALRLAAIIRRRRIDAVVACSAVLVAPVLAARLARVPVIVHVQEAPKSRAARALFAFHGALASTVVAISPWIASAFTAPRANVLLNPVGIVIPPRPARPPRAQGAPLQLAVVGTIDRHKRQDLAVTALARLIDDGVDARLTLVGAEADAGYAAEVRALAARGRVEEQVHFAGQSADVAGHLLKTDVMLLPAGEVTPLVLMEAMALETPVVAARMGSIPDVVVEGTGLLVEPDDPNTLAGAVRRIADDPALASGIAASGRRHVEAAFDERRSHERLIDELERLLARRG